MISAVVLTKNEEKNVIDCLQSLGWCDEIIVVDDYSTDGTLEKIKRLDSKKVVVYRHALNNDFSQQRNFGLSKVKGEWVLFVDADERVSSSLQYEVLSIINATIENYTGFYIKRKDILWGRKLGYGELARIKLLRLGKKDSGEWVGDVHEVWKVKGKVGELKNPLLHYPHQGMTEFLQEINFYTDIRSQELFKKRVKVYGWSIVGYPVGKFVQNYILRLGFLDGVRGLIVALCMSLHSFLVRGKLWLLWQKV